MKGNHSSNFAFCLSSFKEINEKFIVFSLLFLWNFNLNYVDDDHENILENFYIFDSWDDYDSRVEMLNENSDKCKYLNFIETFWLPFFRIFETHSMNP